MCAYIFFSSVKSKCLLNVSSSFCLPPGEGLKPTGG